MFIQLVCFYHYILPNAIFLTVFTVMYRSVVLLGIISFHYFDRQVRTNSSWAMFISQYLIYFANDGEFLVNVTSVIYVCCFLWSPHLNTWHFLYLSHLVGVPFTSCPDEDLLASRLLFFHYRVPQSLLFLHYICSSYSTLSAACLYWFLCHFLKSTW